MKNKVWRAIIAREGAWKQKKWGISWVSDLVTGSQIRMSQMNRSQIRMIQMNPSMYELLPYFSDIF